MRQFSLLFLQNLLITSKHPNPLSSFCCSMPFGVTVLQHLDASFNDSEPLSQLLKRHGRVLRLWHRLLRFLKRVLFQNFNKIVQCELLIVGVRQVEDIFNIVRTNLRAWIGTLGLATNCIRKSRV